MDKSIDGGGGGGKAAMIQAIPKGPLLNMNWSSGAKAFNA